MPHLKSIEEELIFRGIRYEVLAEGQVNQIRSQIANPDVNMEIVQLEKAPKIAVYTPPDKQPWDDAVTMVLEYAEINYEKFTIQQLLWECFLNMTGCTFITRILQVNTENFMVLQGTSLGISNKLLQQKNAKNLGFTKVSELKLAVAKNLKTL